MKPLPCVDKSKLATSQNKFVAEAQASNEVIQEKVASLIVGLE